MLSPAKFEAAGVIKWGEREPEVKAVMKKQMQFLQRGLAEILGRCPKQWTTR